MKVEHHNTNDIQRPAVRTLQHFECQLKDIYFSRYSLLPGPLASLSSLCLLRKCDFFVRFKPKSLQKENRQLETKVKEFLSDLESRVQVVLLNLEGM